MLAWFVAGVMLVPGGPEAAAQAATTAAAQAQPPVVAEIRVHGNLATPEADILGIADVQIGMLFDEALPERVAERLRAADRFDGVEVLKRFASLTDSSRILLVIVVDDGPVDVNWFDNGLAEAIVTQRRGVRPLVVPILDVDDGYGFSYGARFAFTGGPGRRSRLSFPLTWGGHKRAAVELDVPLEGGLLLTRVTGGAALTRERNPFFDEQDSRRSVWVRGERRLTDALAAGLYGGLDRVSFAGGLDRVIRVGVDGVFDTRLDPFLARNAVYARAAWERVTVDGRAIRRREADVRGHLGLIGQSVLVVRGLREDASETLPPYLQPMLGGTRNLRGFQAGSDANDTLMAGSLELLVPRNSPLSVGRVGVSAFLDVGAVYPVGEEVWNQKFERAVGGSVWLAITVVRLSLAVAHGLGGDNRVHFNAGVSF